MGFTLRMLSALAATVLPWFIDPAWTQDLGDVNRGRALALRVCASCHGVRPNENSSHIGAPPFYFIAEIRGMSRMALHAALLTPHREMPNIILESQERADVIAYILTLKPK